MSENKLRVYAFVLYHLSEMKFKYDAVCWAFYSKNQVGVFDCSLFAIWIHRDNRWSILDVLKTKKMTLYINSEDADLKRGQAEYGSMGSHTL